MARIKSKPPIRADSAPAPPPPSPALDNVLVGFDAEMAELAARLERLGIVSELQPADP